MRLIKANVAYMVDGKKVNQTFYVDAETFTEAEAKVIEELGAVEVKALGIVNFDGFYDGNEESWFKAVMNSVMIDEVSAKEKRQRYTALANGSSVEQVTRMMNTTKLPTDELIKVEKINIEGIIK